MKYIIGIDPGSKGGICVISVHRRNAISVNLTDMSKLNETDIADILRMYHTEESVCYLEKVHSMPKQGVASTFTFGQAYGYVRGLLQALIIPIVDVQPRKWQDFFSLLRTNSNESISDKKRRHKLKARQLFPNLKPTLKTVDALLIAEYGRRLTTRSSSLTRY